jgi:hypothetical protein
MDSLLKTTSGFLVRFKIPPKTYLAKIQKKAEAECDKLYPQQQASSKTP